MKIGLNLTEWLPPEISGGDGGNEMQIKTSELIGTALDWAVAKAEGFERVILDEDDSQTYHVYVEKYAHPDPLTYEAVAQRSLPFTVYGVGEHRVEKVEVIRCGIDESVGATAPSITVRYPNGRHASSSICLFFDTQADAEKSRLADGGFSDWFSPSTDWAQGGPIIAREDIAFRKYHKPESTNHGTYYARVCRESGTQVHWHKTTGFQHTGPTALIAAMRCYVASKLGDTVDVPDQLYRG